MGLKEVTVVIGHKDGMVVLQNMGNEEVKPSHINWTPQQAREAAALILASADEAETEELRKRSSYCRAGVSDD